MTLSYNWLHDYLPVNLEPEKLSKILTSIGLEVESFEKYESHKGGLQGLIIGEVLESSPHPNADKLKITKVNIGAGTPLQIVCGAANVAAGQKVVVATVGTTIYPHNREPMVMKVATIRGVESHGMICAEDEIGISEDHSGIMVLPPLTKPGTPAIDYFQPYSDWTYEIGLTPNRMDAMSHLGVARDVCAYLVHHDKKDHRVRSPFINGFKPDNHSLPIEVAIENTHACHRYSGVSMTNVVVKDSPKWLQQKLRSIGQRPINNIVDITNFILHETGQPLHAFDADKIEGKKIVVKNLPEGTVFKTLDEKERKLSDKDLMICNADDEGMCIAGVFGGLNSGVKPSSRNIFVESAWFNPVDIRRTSFRHGLRTDAAMRFEKNVDISTTVQVLKRATLMIRELAGGEIASEIVDVYPVQSPKHEITLNYHYLKKLSGKNYHSDTVKKILQALGFDILKEGIDDLKIAVPYSKPDISLPADVLEEVMRIDGYDNIDIPSSITITPAVETDGYKHAYKEKVSEYLAGTGFHEIFTNSITNAAYFDDSDLDGGVRLLNNLSAVHNIMRPSMLETGLEAVAYNLNRKNTDLQFFEFGKTYHSTGMGIYQEKDHLCLYITGNKSNASWRSKAQPSDTYFLKSIVTRILQLIGIDDTAWTVLSDTKLEHVLQVMVKGKPVATAGSVKKHELNRFDIKQPVLFASFDWRELEMQIAGYALKSKELPKQLPVYRDVAMIVPKSLQYATVENTIRNMRLNKLKEIKLFDIFESEKLGADKKSLAISITFLDEEKTLTDTEIDSMMDALMSALEKDLHAEIRK
ncbi:MAG: phenylalanine--tRNA ligase subunit beta [Chitinophagaceae bacterium]|nr:phenylalanine--tRNA ligase subunit beta [Chitinophagaceae bacterium]